MKYTPQIADLTEFDSRRSVVRSQSNQINEIGSVEITQPTDLATGISPTGDIIWDALPDFSRYRLIVTKQSDGAEVINATVEGTSYTPSFDASTGYDFQVFAARKIPEEQAEIVVSISGSTTDLQEGSTRQFSANVPVTWSSDNGTIDATGLYTANGTQGSVTVTGTSTDDNTKTDSVIFNVVAQSATGLDSEAGDIATLEALATSTSADILDEWATTGMSLNPAPQGVTVATINNELRVTGIDLKNLGLTGHVNIPEWKNLKKCELVNFVLNALDTELPQELFDLSNQSLKHLYVCASDSATEEFATQQMHEYVYTDPNYSATGELRYIHPGKSKGNENNVIRGSIKAPQNSSTSLLENFICTWSDSHYTTPDGISSIDTDFWNQPNMKIIWFYLNFNLSEQPIPSSFPTGLTHLQCNGKGMFSGTLSTQLNGCTSLQHCLFNIHENLTYDWNQMDFRNHTDMLQYFQFRGGNHIGPYPDYLMDGRFPRIEQISMPGYNGDGFTGQLGTFSPLSSGLSIFGVDYHQLSGAIPASIFNNISNLIICYFTANKFTSFESLDLTGINAIRNLYFSNNEIRGQNLPYVDWGNVPRLSRFRFGLNYYTFQNMLWVPPNAPAGETWFELMQAQAANAFEYSPQNRFGFLDDISGNSIDFSAHVGHADNVYEWQRSTDGGSTFNVVTGETGSSIDTSLYGSGIYRLVVSNSNIPDLVTRRLPETYISDDPHFQSVEIEI